MSDIGDAARVLLLIADHIALDGTGKVNALGAAFTITGIAPTGLTPPTSLVAIIDLPSKFAGVDFAVSIELRDVATDQPVSVVITPEGAQEPLRIQQVARGERPTLGIYLPNDLPLRVQMLLGFAGGLPLTAGHSYFWRMEIDGQHLPQADVSFHVAGTAPGPVLGGPVGPADVRPV